MVLFVAVGGRLVSLQVVAPEAYVSRGEAQRLRTIELPAERGAIFDRNGAELALSVRQRTVWADPSEVVDASATAALLAPVLDQGAASLEEALSGDGRFAYLARKVGDDVAARVDALGIEGVGLLDESQRYAPAGDLAASLLGVVDIDNRGTAGLERQYDDVLVGTPGSLSIERGPDGRTIAGGRQRLDAPDRGDDLVLTLDRALQYEVERALGDQITATDAEAGMAIVMDPRSGEILAMANLRAPDDAGEGAEPQPSRDNMALTSVFEPGSVNKVVTLAAALEEGVFTTEDVLDVPDNLQVSIHRYSDSSRHPIEQWTPQRHPDHVVQRGDHHDRPGARARAHRRVPATLRSRAAHRSRVARRVPGNHAAPGRVVGHVDRFHPHRLGRRRQRLADAERVQRGGQRG